MLPEIENKHRVQKRTWTRWGNDSRQLFNDLYELMEDQRMVIHPEAAETTTKYWATTAWNFAWLAADLLNARQKRTVRRR